MAKAAKCKNCGVTMVKGKCPKCDAPKGKGKAKPKGGYKWGGSTGSDGRDL